MGGSYGCGTMWDGKAWYQAELFNSTRHTDNSVPQKAVIMSIDRVIFLEIYLDNSATTKVCPEAAQKALQMMTEVYGNPSSLHTMGYLAQKEMDKARAMIAEALSAEKEEIIFTSGGTESNNTAVFGAVKALSRRGKKIVTTAVEHSSVMAAAQVLEQQGFEVVYLPVDESGRVRPESIAAAIDDKTILVSMMAVNNETGAIQPIEAVRKILDRAKAPALFHVDAVQAFGKMALKPKKLGIDLLSVSSHKIHGPKGAGILYIRKGVRMVPLHYGGEQEKRIRPGTEAVPLICAMGEAVRVLPDYRTEWTQMQALNAYARERLSGIEHVVINSSPDSMPYILNLSVVGIRSETMLHYLAQKNIYVSSGSACAKGQKSHVLSAMGLSPERIDSAIRLSFSRYNTREDIDHFCEELEKANQTLARSR